MNRKKVTDINTYKTYDYIIIGQGLAGSLLAHELLAYSENVLVIDDNYKSSSSTMAAGLINPVTGMRLVKTNNVETLLPFALTVYKTLEKTLNLSLLHETKMIRLLQNDKEIIQFSKRQQDPQYAAWIGKYYDALSHKSLSDKFGSFEQLQTAWLDIPELLTGIRTWLIPQNKTTDQFETRFVRAAITDTLITTTSNTQSELISLRLNINDKQQTVATKHLILCRGYKEKDSDYFGWLPFQVAKGEILTLRANKPVPSALINFGQWVIPIDKYTIKTGASWDREIINSRITPGAKTQLMRKLDSIYKIPGLEFTVIDQQAGIRPCTQQRQPFIGSHPSISALKIFNGFGSKGSLLIPYYAKEYAKQLCCPPDIMNPLLKACDIGQFTDAC